jgi:acyl carrier protein
MTALGVAKELLAEAIHAGAEAVPDDARIGSLERWDSLAHMHLLLGIEEKLGRKLDPDEAVRIECIADVADLLNGGDAGLTPEA